MASYYSIEEESDDEDDISVSSNSHRGSPAIKPTSIGSSNDNIVAASSDDSMVPPLDHPLAGGESRIPMPTLDLDLINQTKSSNITSPHPIESGAQSVDGTSMSGLMPMTMAAPLPPSMFNLLGVLNNYRMRVRCHTLDNLFSKINLDARTWHLLIRSQLPRNDLAMGLDQLLDTVTEFVKRLNRKSSTRVNTILDNVMYTEEVNFAYRVYSRSNTLFGQIFRYLKPLFLGVETYMENERGQLPCLNLKGLYQEMKIELDDLYAKMEATAMAAMETQAAKDEANSKAGSKSGSAAASNAGSKRTSMSSSGILPGRTRLSSRRGSLKEDARKKASIAHALAQAALVAKAEEAASSSGGATKAASTAASSRQPSRPVSASTSVLTIPQNLKSARSSFNAADAIPEDSDFESSLQVATAHLHVASSSTPSPPESTKSSAHPPPSHPSTSTSAAALAAQALAAASDATTAAERVLQENAGDESEEEDVITSGPSSDDIFSKLLAATQTHQYPLPPRLNRAKRAQPRPHLEFLGSYLTHHMKSCSLVENLIDCYLLSLMCALVALALTETLQKRELYSGILSEVNTLASHFVRLGLPLIDRLCAIEPGFVVDNLMNLSFVQIEHGVLYSDLRQIIRKCRLLHSLFASLDIFIFPRIIAAHKQGTKCISLSHFQHEEFVVTGGYDLAVRIWDLKRNKCLGQFIGHQSIITWCVFSLQDTWIISGSFDGTLRVWNARTGECLKVLTGHTDGILDGDFGVKDKYIVSGSMDCSVRLWSAASGKCLRIHTGHRHWVKSVRFANDGQSIISGGLDRKIFVWNLRTGGGTTSGAGPRHILTHANYVLDLLVISPDRFLSTSKDQTLKVWDLRSGKCELELSNPSKSTCLTLGLSPDGSLIASGFFDNTINIYDILKNCELKRQMKIHNDGILTVKWLNNRTLVVGTATGNIQILHI